MLVAPPPSRPVTVSRWRHREPVSGAEMNNYPAHDVHTEGVPTNMAARDADANAGRVNDALESAQMLSEVGARRESVRRSLAYGPWETV